MSLKMPEYDAYLFLQLSVGAGDLTDLALNVGLLNLHLLQLGGDVGNLALLVHNLTLKGGDALMEFTLLLLDLGDGFGDLFVDLLGLTKLNLETLCAASLVLAFGL